MNQPLVVIFCDDLSTGNLWELLLKERQCTTAVFSTNVKPSAVLKDVEPDLAVIDLTLRKSNGVQICSAVRQSVKCPILFLTPINNESFQLEAYQAGVEECAIKPISPALFLSKVKAWLRCTPSNFSENVDNSPRKIGALELNNRFFTREDGARVHLSLLETRVLSLLMSRPGEVFGSEEIIERVWGIYGDYKSLKNVIYRLRRKIEHDPSRPRTLFSSPGSGYFIKS